MDDSLSYVSHLIPGQVDRRELERVPASNQVLLHNFRQEFIVSGKNVT